jgi:hypothetical protein
LFSSPLRRAAEPLAAETGPLTPQIGPRLRQFVLPIAL